VRKRNLEILSEARAETAPGFLRFATGGQCMQFHVGESLDEVRKRFQRMVEEGRANENDDYIIFRWQW
jgi:hypothetical protein